MPQRQAIARISSRGSASCVPIRAGAPRVFWMIGNSSETCKSAKLRSHSAEPQQATPNLIYLGGPRSASLQPYPGVPL